MAIWNEIPKKDWEPTIQTITYTTFSWLCHFCIYCHNNKLNVDDIDKFINAVLLASKGQNDVIVKGRIIQLHKDNLSQASRLQIRLDCQFTPDLIGEKREKQNTSQMKPGMQAAHLTPVAHNPNGDDGIVVPVDGIRNRSIGASKMTLSGLYATNSNESPTSEEINAGNESNALENE